MVRHALVVESEELQTLSAERQSEYIRELNIQLASHPDQLEELCDVLQPWFKRSGLLAYQVKQLCHAVREVVANSIEWGHRYDSSRVVDVKCQQDAEQVSVLVSDTGPGFDRRNLPHAARPGDPLSHLDVRAALQLREGGFGILMASGLVDYLCYSETGNEALLVKYLPQSSEY